MGVKGGIFFVLEPAPELSSCYSEEGEVLSEAEEQQQSQHLVTSGYLWLQSHALAALCSGGALRVPGW